MMKSEAYLYVMQAASGLIKIGRSHAPEQRRRSLEKASGQRIVTLLTLYGHADDERKMHDKLSMHRGIGEWFANTPESRKAICDAFGVAISFNPGGLFGSKRTTEERRSAVQADVRRLAGEILGYEYPKAWIEAGDDEERMEREGASAQEINAMRKAVGLGEYAVPRQR